MGNLIVESKMEGSNIRNATFDPVLVGIAAAMGMMPTYHAEAGNSNPRLSRTMAVYDVEEVAKQMQDLYGIPQAFFRSEDPSIVVDSAVYPKFLASHQNTVIATPNYVHGPLAEAAIDVPFHDEYAGQQRELQRYIYDEKPPSNSLEGAILLANLEKSHPGRIAVVSQNRLWDMLLEMRHLIASGLIGPITNGNVDYRQDYQKNGEENSAGWRTLKGWVGEPGDDADGIIGKLIDILFHGLDVAEWTAGQEITGVDSARIITTEPKRKVSEGGPFAAKGEKTKEQIVTVGGKTNYHGDDYLTSTVMMGKVPMNVTISQTDAGHPNYLAISVYGKKGALHFTTDDPMNLYYSKGGRKMERIGYSATEMEHTATLPEYIREGLDIRATGPFGYHTPGGHMTGWKQVHRRQLQHWLQYVQLASRGKIDPKVERAKLFTVPTPQEALRRMIVARTMYEVAAKQKTTAVDYLRTK